MDRAAPELDPHAAPGSTGDWGPEVASALDLEGDSAAFIDALLPPDEAGFWTWADARTAGASRVAALTTIGFHRRSRERIVERYDASTSRARDRLPAGVEAVALRGAGEVAYWLLRPRALVFGDRLLGDDAGGLRLCPESWISYLGDRLTLARLRELLRPLLDLPRADPGLARRAGARRRTRGAREGDLMRLLETCLYHDPGEAEAIERFYAETLGLPGLALARRPRPAGGAGRAPAVRARGARRSRRADRRPRHGRAGTRLPGRRGSRRLRAPGSRDLREAGVEITHEHEWDGGRRSFYFRDPAGNLLELADGDLWPE